MGGEEIGKLTRGHKRLKPPFSLRRLSHGWKPCASTLALRSENAPGQRKSRSRPALQALSHLHNHSDQDFATVACGTVEGHGFQPCR